MDALLAVHAFLRDGFGRVAGLVRAVADGDAAPAREVASHLAFLGRCLRHQQQTESALILPVLLRRVPAALAPIVRLRQAQQERIATLLTDAERALPADRDRCAELLDRLHVNLIEHLDALEDRLLPVAAVLLDRREWAAIEARVQDNPASA